MLYEVRTYTFTPGHVDEAVEAFGRIFERRQKLSPLIGYFVCVMGELHRILSIWEYENSAHREAIRAETERHDWWPPLDPQHIHKQVTRLLRSLPFRPKALTGAMGSIYVIHSDFLKVGKLAEVTERWTRHLPQREKLSPLAGAFVNRAGDFESGILNEFMHVWPYRDLNHWASVTQEAAAIPGWRESLDPYTTSQTAEAWLPVAYSPMR